MDISPQLRLQGFLQARRQHPAWQLLASRRAPVMLSCLRDLFDSGQRHEGVPYETAIQSLADMLTTLAMDAEVGTEGEDPAAAARRELREWIRRLLVVEREGRLYATDALESALQFVQSLDGRIMTSTASRLSIVQREIERLESGLNPDAESRAARIRRQIADLQQELQSLESGDVPVLDDATAIEGMREVYVLATSLRADFRRVEDSWREADRALRHAIVNDHQHRGAVVDRLLDGHDLLLSTPEGRVFQGFQQQLGRSQELDQMKLRLRAILRHPTAAKAFTPVQQDELRWLVMRLVGESSAVIRARARSERDVRNFLKTGLAAEQHRVGMLLNALFREAQHLDWRDTSVLRTLGSLPPIGISLAGVPLVERLRFKALDAETRKELALQMQRTDLSDVDEEFWSAFDGLDREALVMETLALLRRTGASMTWSDLVTHLPPTHDLESLALWLSMAREVDKEFGDSWEALRVTDREGQDWQFTLPSVTLHASDFEAFDWEP
jgi:hypothetical protein